MDAPHEDDNATVMSMALCEDISCRCRGKCDGGTQIMAAVCSTGYLPINAAGVSSLELPVSVS